MHILISRTDNIGDVVLTLPLVGFIKEKMPKTTISFLGKSYTESLCNKNRDIDHFFNWDHLSDKNELEIASFLKEKKIDVIVHVYPNKKVAKASSLANIPLRIGTAHRWYHLFHCNQRIFFSRKKSKLHEAELNFKLIEKYLSLKSIPSKQELARYVHMDVESKTDFGNFQLDTNKKNFIFHTKSFGSAVDWEIQNYIDLCKKIDSSKYHIYFSGTKKESPLISPYIKELVSMGVATDVTGAFNLTEFITFINSCDGMLACSTGPLHISSILGKKAIGLFSSKRPIHSGRWAPIGLNSIVVNSKDETSDVANINLISSSEVFNFFD